MASLGDMLPDRQVVKCTACGVAIEGLVLKRHCRNCGHVFCDNCTTRRIALTIQANAPLARVCDQCHVAVAQRLTAAEEEFGRKLQDFERCYKEDCEKFSKSVKEFETELEKFECKRSSFEEKEKQFFDHEIQYMNRQSEFLSYDQQMTAVRESLVSEIQRHFEVRRRKLDSPDPFEAFDMNRLLLEAHESQFAVYKRGYLEYEKKFNWYKKCFEVEKKLRQDMMDLYQITRSMDLKTEVGKFKK